MDEHRKFHELAADYKTAILVTVAPDGSLHARPMEVARLESDGRAYFSTAIDSPKIAELTLNAQAVATFQNEKQFATLSGTVSLSRDPALVDALWQDEWLVWFPAGKHDPRLSILILDGEWAEYWDRAGMQDIAYSFAKLVAGFTGEEPVLPREEHEKMRF